jgi:hypothetical protein
MKTTLVLGVLAMVLALAAPAQADHNSLAPGANRAVESKPNGTAPEGMTTDKSLDINLKIGLDGFRLGSRIFGSQGYAGGAWLNGQMRPDGFSLDGRVEKDGRAQNFKMNVDLDEWMRRAATWWLLGRMTDL